MARQHRLRFALRGAEWGFAIREGDFERLEDVAVVACDFWNGANSLLIGVSKEGGISPDIHSLLAVCDVERVLLDRAIEEGARQGLVALFEGRHEVVSEFGSRLTRLELHPLNLQPAFREPSADGPTLALPVPVFDDEVLQRLVSIVWGRIDDDDRPSYGEAFLLEPHDGPSAHFALLDGQLSGLAPLAQSTYLMGAYQQLNPTFGRYLMVVDGDDFGDLAFFWNLRARASSRIGRAVVALPRASFDYPDQLRALRDWTSDSLEVTKPDILVIAKPEYREPVAMALGTLGFREAGAGASITTYSGGAPPDREQPEYLFARGVLGGKLRRGVFTEQLVSLESGRNATSLEPSPSFGVRYWGHHVRLDLLNWPLAFPPTRLTAERVHPNAFVYERAVSLLTSASNSPYNFDLVVPGSDDLLQDFLADRRFAGAVSAAGRYALALIGRIGGISGLDALAQRGALDVLEPLASPSRLKLIQRMEHKLVDMYGDEAPSREELGELIRDQVLELDASSLSLDDLAGKTGTARPALLASLETLIDAGFVRRGRVERCRNCGYEGFYSLDELAERVICHACRERFLLAVAKGPNEPRLSYQLDPLMARAMDQDLMPVLLTLRYLYSPEGAAAGAFWPGLEVTDEQGAKQDCDILIAQDGQVRVSECKKSAPGLSLDQAERTMALAERFGATTIFAALEGEFSEDVRELAELGGARLITRELLLPEAG